MNTVGQAVSRIRNNIKSVKGDPFVTDRYIYSLILSYGKTFLSKINTIGRFETLFRTIPCMDLVEVNKVEACCDVKSDCVIKRTKEKLPDVIQGYSRPMLRRVSSVDGSIEVLLTNPATFASMSRSSSWKYNKAKYYWFLNGYLYFPEITWDQIMIDGVFNGLLDDQCGLHQDTVCPIPDSVFGEIEPLVLKNFILETQFPEDPIPDKQNQLR